MVEELSCGRVTTRELGAPKPLHVRGLPASRAAGLLGMTLVENHEGPRWQYYAFIALGFST